MKIDMKEEFPCGYKAEIHINSIWIGTLIDFQNKTTNTECPLHGKNCPPK